jgi:hypothetical protein
MPIDVKKGESEQDFVSRCIADEINNGREQDQAAAICYSTYEKSTSMSAYTQNRIKTQMALAVKDAANRGILLAETPSAGPGSYPWDECIADQVARYGDEETAKKVCGYIKSEYGG